MLRAKGKHNGIIGSRGLQLEIERATKPFAQRQSPRAVHPNAKWRVNDQLHSAGLIEEPLQHQFLLRRNNAQRFVSRSEIVSKLFGAGFGKAGFGNEPRHDLCSDQLGFGSLLTSHEPTHR